MQRLLKALLLSVAFVLVGQSAFAQALPIVQVSGRLPQTGLRVLTKDTLYQVAGDYHVSGILLIEPGTTVEFLPNGRLIDSVGGRIIADGDLQATWNRSTPDLSIYPGGYADIDFIRDNVSIGGKPEITAPGPNWMDYAPYLYFYYANHLDRYPSDPNLKNVPYRRDVVRAPIIFRGRPVNKFSREWGHIVILPGADSAIFRNVQFVNFRKDTAAVKTTEFYTPYGADRGGLYNNGQIIAADRLNRELRSLTTGGGGALTVFSSKTWILDCRFDSNFARYHGGAVQFLQAPYDQTTVDPAYSSFYPPDPALGPRAQHGAFRYPSFNPETYDIYGQSISTPFGPIPILTVTDPRVTQVVGPGLPPGPPPTGPVQYRQTYDDGRQSINMGRVRRVTFRDNRAVVSNFTEDINGYRDNIDIVEINGSTLSGTIAKNEAYGGAVYISGRRHITVYFGRALGDPMDTIVAERNYAVNYQQGVAGSNGARGGAFYVGDSTSMVFQLSRFASNFTAVPNVAMDDYVNRGRMSQGGGIYMSKTSPELTVRDVIHFRDNKAGQGGGIYVAAVTNPFGNNIPVFDPFLSPNLLGDSVYFIRNIAEYDGGAIYTQRNMRIDGRNITRTDAGGRLVDHRILLDSNAAGLAGGGIVIDNQTNMLNSNARVTRALISNNSAGDSAMASDLRLIKLYDPVANPFSPINPYGVSTVTDSFRLPQIITKHIIGGGGIYSKNGNTNFYQSVEFNHNWAKGGNGGAISLVTPVRTNRYFVAEGDVAYNFQTNAAVPFQDGPEPNDMREMTRFLRNYALKDSMNPSLNVDPRDPSGLTTDQLLDPKRNGTGLGGAVYINDRQPPGPNPGYARTDSVLLHRVRMEENQAWSGAAVYSDNYELRVFFRKSMIAGNRAVSDEGRNVDVIDNPATSPAASRTAGAIFYGDIEGPLPQEEYHTGANSIFDNDARFLIRLPDVPQGMVGQGRSGVDSLRGNFWGQVEAPVTTVLASGTLQNTFYIQGNGCTLPLKNPVKLNEQGPFESRDRYAYTPLPVGMVPDTLLLEGRIYDIFDKGVDINSVDYSIPRMAPIEDFSVGLPDRLRTFGTLGGPNSPYMDKVVRRLTRDPFVAEIDTCINRMQREWVGDHPIGYPLFLEALANYLGDPNTDNNDQYALNHTVFFVINAETGEFVRANLRQIREGSDLFRSRIEFVADSINRDPVLRRSLEGRAGFSIGEFFRLSPRYYMEQGFNIEQARLMAARYEDSVALDGRRHGGLVSELGGPNFRYVNRVNPVTFADVYSGERYHALPVLTGDRIWVVSRTMLWDMSTDITTVVNNARFAGLEFSIDDDNSVMAPIIYGDRDSLSNKQPAELRNTRFVIEDSRYASDPTGRTRSGIFDVTAIDLNGFFDPRSCYFPDRYTGLRYEWTPLLEFPGSNVVVPSTDPSQVRLASWLKADTVFPSNVDPAAVTRDSAHAYGYVRFYGTPHNPDVVPGGELFEIRVSNYPPSIRTIDSLVGLVPADTAAKYIYLYPPYFNCQVYDPQTARYLQQDTIDVSGASTASYRFRIFVQDTRPNFTGDVYPCVGRGGIAVANLTDTLRFNYNVQTDDEAEDNTAALNEGWTFPYGRTTYGFVFTDVNPQGNTPEIDDAKEVRPVWLADKYLLDGNRQPDQGATVLQQGDVIVRIDSSEAYDILKNPAQANNVYNLDSLFTIVANDGHTGQNQRNIRAIVNTAPHILPKMVPPLPQGPRFGVLPPAKEDVDYNPTLLDETKQIKAEDYNYGQRVRFALVYRDDARNAANFVGMDLRTGVTVTDKNGTPIAHTPSIAYVRRDACYTEAGLFNAPKTTPSWLNINPISGILYGTPGLNDAPHLGSNPTPGFGPDTVTVVAIDEYGLTDVQTFILDVDSTNHRPRLFGRPAVQCVVAGEAYNDSLCVRDRDLLRLDERFLEELTLRGWVDDPRFPGVTISVNPTLVKGGATAASDTFCFQVSSNIPQNLQAGKMPINIEVTDKGGNKDTLTYEIAISESVIWTMPLRVQNTNVAEQSVAYQDLIFGIARNATTGDEPSALGKLDSQYCEYEIPPKPPTDVFDSRWDIVTTNGVLRNIFPENPSPGQGAVAWKGSFQAGHLPNSSPNLPITLCWKIADAQGSPKNIHIMDQADGVLFRVDMKNPTAHGVKLTQGVNVRLLENGTVACVEISLTTVTGFKIAYGLTSGVNDEPTTGSALGYLLSQNAPNPFTSSTNIEFFAPKSGNATLEIFDVNGKLIKTLVDGTVDAGRNVYPWDGTDEKGRGVASGAYTYRLTSGATVLSRTMILMR